MDISAAGYIPFEAFITVNEGSTTYLDTFLMVEGSEDETGVASGRITNAQTGSGVGNAALIVRRGWNNVDSGEVVATGVTSSAGDYSFELPLGNYTVYAERTGFIPTHINIVVQRGTTGSQNGAMTPIVETGSFRIVLTWGENPCDLDSHMVGERADGSSFHVYYNNKHAYDGDIEVCNLDVDDITSYGPETITLNPTTAEPYYYFVYHFSGSSNIANSSAKVRVYQGESLVLEVNAPIDGGSGRYWNVFAIVNGELVIRNDIADSANVEYAD